MADDDYRDPLASAHARIAALEHENEELRRAAAKGPAAESLFLTGEAEAVRCDEELVRIDMAWERRWNTGVDFDPKKPKQRLANLGKVIVGAAVLVTVGPPLLGMLSSFATICFALLLLVAAWIWTLAERQMIREWPEHRAKRAELQRAAALARAGGGEVSPVGVRVVGPESAIAFVEHDDSEPIDGRSKDRR